MFLRFSDTLLPDPVRLQIRCFSYKFFKHPIRPACGTAQQTVRARDVLGFIDWQVRRDKVSFGEEENYCLGKT